MNTKRHICLILLAAASLAGAQAPVAPAKVDPPTPDATPGLAPRSPAAAGNVPLPAPPPEDEPAAADPAAEEPVPVPAPAPAAGAGRPNLEKPVTPTTPRRLQNSLSRVPVPVSPSPEERRASRRNSFESSYPGPARTPAPAPPRDRADQIIRDTKLKVLQTHYETALSELMTSERALIDVPDDKRPAMETRVKGLRGFVEKLEADIQKLGAGAAVGEHGRMDGGAESNRWKVRTSARPQPAAGTPELPGDSKRAAYPPGEAAGGATYELPAEPAPTPAPAPAPTPRSR